MTDAQSPSPRPVASTTEAELVMAHLNDVMDTLLSVVVEETRLVRAGRPSQASELEPSKVELSRLYFLDTSRLQASQSYLARTVPDAFAALRRRHDEFHAVLQMNLTVLATAHAMSESIMRGKSGRIVPPPAGGMRPLTVSRAL